MSAPRPANSRSAAIRSIALLGLPLAASPALAQDRLAVDVSASAGVSTNPFLQAGPSPAAISATIGVRPSWISERPLTTLRLDGSADLSFYDQGYGTNGSISVQGSGVHKLSERTSLNASLGYVNTIVGSFSDVGVPIGGPIIVATPVPTGTTVGGETAAPVVPVLQPGLPNYLIDPALNGIGQRRQAYLVSGGLVTMLSPRDQLSFITSASANRSNNSRRSGFGGLNDFNTVTPTFSYMRTIDENFSVGASFTVGFTDYLGTSASDATIYQPSLLLTRGFGRWTLSAGLGAAIVDLTEITGESRTSTSLNGNASLCRRDERWNACFNAARQTVPSAFQGVRTQTSVSGTLGYRLSARDDLSLNAGYSRASEPLQRDLVGVPRDGSVDFVNASGNYSRRLSPALSGNLTLGYAKALNDGFGRDANLTALVGVSYRFGRQP